MKRLLKRLIRERCPRFPTFDKNKKLASDFERQERQGWGRGGHREAEADRDYPQTQERGMTGVVTQTISDYNFNPHYYHDKEDFPNPVIIVSQAQQQENCPQCWGWASRGRLEDAHVGAPHQAREAYPGQHPWRDVCDHVQWRPRGLSEAQVLSWLMYLSLDCIFIYFRMPTQKWAP